MTKAEDVRSQLQKKRQKLESTRKQIQEREKQAEKVRKQVEKEREKIPKPTQRKLRSGLYSGLEGRKRRRIVEAQKKELKGKEQEIGLFKKGLTEFKEKELKPFEKRLEKEEEGFKEWEKQKEAYDKALKIASISDPRAVFALSGKLEKEYYRQIKSMSKEPQESVTVTEIAPEISSVDTDTITVEKIKEGMPAPQFKVGDLLSAENWRRGWEAEKLKRAGVSESDILKREGESFDLSGGSKNIPSISFSMLSPRGISRTDKLKDYNEWSSLDLKKVGKDVRGVTNKPFRTTGSPIRFTQIGSLKSRGHLGDKPRIQKIQSKSKPKRKLDPSIMGFTAPKKTKEVKIKSNFLFGNSKEKKKKKRNLWGF